MTQSSARIPRTSKIPDHAHSMEMEVPFHDIDSLLVVWHGHYLKYMEISRCALLKKFDLDVFEMVRIGYRFMVAEMSCRYTNALTYGDKFRITSWFTETEHKIGIAYEIYNITRGKRAFRGTTDLITVSAEGKLQMSTPKVILDKLPVLTKRSSSSESKNAAAN